MSNCHLQDINLSLRAKGMMSIMLSLPTDWKFSKKGLATISGESEHIIDNVLKELTNNGYLTITKILPKKENGGRITYQYDIYENPQIQGGKKQGVELQGVELQGVENCPLYINTKKQNTNLSNTNLQKSKSKKKYGEYKNVLLTDDELKKLKNKFSDYENKIKQLDEGIELKGYKYKNHYLAILKWNEKENEEQKNASYDIEKAKYNAKYGEIDITKRR